MASGDLILKAKQQSTYILLIIGLLLIIASLFVAFISGLQFTTWYLLSIGIIFVIFSILYLANPGYLLLTKEGITIKYSLFKKLQTYKWTDIKDFKIFEKKLNPRNVTLTKVVGYVFTEKYVNQLDGISKLDAEFSRKHSMEDGAVGYGENYGMEVTGSCTLLNQWSAKYSKV